METAEKITKLNLEGLVYLCGFQPVFILGENYEKQRDTNVDTVICG
jgi:hypothetical protein